MTAPKNPYEVADELRHQSWLHGFNSKSKDDCPYEAGTLEAEAGIPAWKAGFTAGQSLRGEQQPVKKTTPKTANFTSTLETFSEEQLFEELRKRKKGELESLLKQRDELNIKILKLEALFND
jgi:ribosome modulation factor